MGLVHVNPGSPFSFINSWGKKTWIIAGSAAAVGLILIIVVPVEVAKENAYPSYTSINYTLADTYSGTDFFDNFDYFTDTGELNQALANMLPSLSQTLTLP